MPELVPAEPGTPGWLAARRAGVTATDIVTILGLSHYDSVYSLFWRKMQQAPEVEDNDRFRLGRELEPIVCGRWVEQWRAGDNCDDEQWLTEGGLWRSTERPWQMASPDGMVCRAVKGRRSNHEAVLELKSWADGDKSSWQDAPPAQVRAQVLWQMDVMDVAVGHVGVVFLPSGEFRSYTIEHDESPVSLYPHIPTKLWPDGCRMCFDLEVMRAAGEEFMARLRLELPPPDPDASMATLAAVRARFTRQPDKQAEIDRDLWGRWAGWKSNQRIAEDALRACEILIREQAGEAAVLTVDGDPVARRIITVAQVKAHTRHQDYLRRIEPKGDDNAEA
jgi:putative phage-type endonuclease